jgi:hypothetical protein
VLYVAEWMRQQQTHSKRIGFARYWLSQILGTLMDKPGPILLSRVVRRLREAGLSDAQSLASSMLAEQQAINEQELADAASGAAVPHLLKNARRAGLLEPDIVDALGLAKLPLIRGALKAAD